MRFKYGTFDAQRDQEYVLIPLLHRQHGRWIYCDVRNPALQPIAAIWYVTAVLHTRPLCTETHAAFDTSSTWLQLSMPLHHPSVINLFDFLYVAPPSRAVTLEEVRRIKWLWQKRFHCKNNTIRPPPPQINVSLDGKTETDFEVSSLGDLFTCAGNC
jgi:hypothetical protein